jgi:hypothetical protein
MASLELTLKGLDTVLTNLFLRQVVVTVKYSEKQRQAAGNITGLPCLGPEHTVKVSATMPVEETEAVKLSRTCKVLDDLYKTLYGEPRKEQLMHGLWNRFFGLVVQEVLAMEQRTTRMFFLRFGNEMEHLCVCAEHQEMQAAHGLTRAPVLDASGALAFVGKEMRIAIRFTSMGKVQVLPHNLAAAGEPDSRTGFLMRLLIRDLVRCVLESYEVSVLEHD